MAAYFVSGAGARGLLSTLIITILGVTYGWVVVTVSTTIPFVGALVIGVGLVAALMCLQAGWGSFFGASCFFGNQAGLLTTILALVVGAGLGWLSDTIGKVIQRGVDRQPLDQPLKSTTEAVH